MFFRVCTSFDLLRMRYVLWFRRHCETSLEESQGRREGITTTSLVCTIQKKRRNKIRNLWLWLGCCSLLPTSNFHHQPFTYIYISTHRHNYLSDPTRVPWRVGHVWKMCGCAHTYSLVSLVQWYKTVTATLPNPSESRQDQEEGSELDSHEEVRRFCGSRRDHWRGGRWCWTLKLAQKRSWAGRWSWTLKVGLLFCFRLLLNSGATDIVLVTAPHSSWNSNCVVH